MGHTRDRSCGLGSSYQVLAQRDFEPALYDIVGGANWQFTGGNVARCVKF